MFIESPLLSADDFVREAGRRGVELERDQLEELHRRRALVPFYEILRRPAAEPLVDVEAPSVVYASSLVREVYRAAGDGRLRDPRLTRFRAWPRGGSATSRYAYSPYQLIALSAVKALQRLMNARTIGDRRKAFLPALPEPALEAADSLRVLAWVLSDLDGRYRPVVTDTVSAPIDEWYALSEAEPKGAEAEVLAGLDAAVLERQADVLLARAKHVDPLGDLARLVRHASARTWYSLRLDALRALDYRIAAELLLLRREALAERGGAAPLEESSSFFWTPRLERLGAPDTELEERLTEFGLSPGPAVTLLVEGETETLIMPRILHLLAPASARLIECHALGSAQRDAVPFAQSLGMVRVAGQMQDYLRLRRPPVGLYVLTDREGKYKTTAERAKQREGVIKMLLAGLAPEHQTGVVRKQLAQLVKVRAWGSASSFEFAHFSDDELADGVLTVGRPAPGRARSDVLEAIRAQRRSDPTPSLDRAVRRIVSSFSKPQLAEHLWPLLKLRCQRALASPASRQPPALREARGILELAYRVRPVTVLRLT